MVGKHRGILWFLGPAWVLITMAPRNTTLIRNIRTFFTLILNEKYPNILVQRGSTYFPKYKGYHLQ